MNKITNFLSTHLLAEKLIFETDQRRVFLQGSTLFYWFVIFLIELLFIPLLFSLSFLLNDAYIALQELGDTLNRDNTNVIQALNNWLTDYVFTFFIGIFILFIIVLFAFMLVYGPIKVIRQYSQDYIEIDEILFELSSDKEDSLDIDIVVEAEEYKISQKGSLSQKYTNEKTGRLIYTYNVTLIRIHQEVEVQFLIDDLSFSAIINRPDERLKKPIGRVTLHIVEN